MISPDHRPLHIVRTTLPHFRNGYNWRTQRLATAQAEIGMTPRVVGEPNELIVEPDEFVSDNVGKSSFGPVDYFALTDPSAVRRKAILFSQGLRKLGVRGASRFGLRFRVPSDGWSRLLSAVASDPSQITVVHGHTPYFCAAQGIEIARRLGVPFVFEVRGFWDLTGEAEGRVADSSEWRRREVELAAGADAVITLGEAMRAELIQRGVASEKIVVVGNGVDVDKFAPDKVHRSFRHSLGLMDEFVVGYVTSVRELEGIDVLLRATQLLVAEGVRIRTLVVGDGPDLPRLKKLSADLGIADQVMYPGRVSEAQVVQYYGAFDVFVVPRRAYRVCEIVTPLKPVEAMAMAVPTVVSNLPALVELVEPGVAGEIFEPNDPEALAAILRRLWEAPLYRKKLGKQAREHVVLRRTWHAAAVATRSLYDDLAYRDRRQTTVDLKRLREMVSLA